MNEEDLYRETQCPRCGGTVLVVASFCPHCGFVFKGSWFEKISKFFRTTDKSAISSPLGRSILPTLISAAIGTYLIYLGVVHESFEMIVGGIFFIYAAVRSRFSPSRPGGGRSLIESTSEKPSSLPQGPVTERLTCENCGAEVASDAVQCPKCGMKFVAE